MKRFNPDIPYNDLPPLPPGIDLETKNILKQLNAANRALAELKGYSQLLPNKNILINTVVLKEAKDSSEIENIITTHDSLYKALVLSSQNIDSPTKEVINYTSALWEGYKLLKKQGVLTTNTIIEIQRELEKNNAGIRKLAGTVLKNDKTGKVIYTPPDNEGTIRNLLHNLELFINTDDYSLDPLIKMSIIHYQFESIHPFYDGNGRTGRIINVLYLILKELLDGPILYLSHYIIQNKNEYYRLLNKVTTEQHWEEWIVFMLNAVEETSKNTLSMIIDIIGLMNKTGEKIRKDLPKIYKKELVEALFLQPYVKIQFLEKHLAIERHTAAKYLKELEKNKIVKSEKIGKEVIYINKHLYELLKK